MTCPVTSGPHRCDRPADHDGEHECVAPEYARTLPAPATLESRVAALEAAVARLIVERAC